MIGNVSTTFGRGKHQGRRRDVALCALDGMAAGRILDAPCGNGILASRLSDAGWEVWTCDRDPTLPGRSHDPRFRVVDLNERLPYADAFFDAVMSLEGMEHLTSPTLPRGVCTDTAVGRPPRPHHAELWLAARRTPPRSPARILGSWGLLLGRSVVVRAVKRAESHRSGQTQRSEE